MPLVAIIDSLLELRIGEMAIVEVAWVEVAYAVKGQRGIKGGVGAIGWGLVEVGVEGLMTVVEGIGIVHSADRPICKRAPRAGQCGSGDGM